MDYKPALKKYWWVPILIAIFVMALWLRVQPLRFNEMPDIDTYYFYRLDKYMLNNNLQLPQIDYLRNFPIGAKPWQDTILPFYFPVYLYVAGGGWGIDFFHYALLLPAVLGALSVVVMFFLTREFFGNKAGLFSAFFLSVIVAYFTRTSGGEFEREAFACVFILLNIWFFVRAYKKSDWRYGLLSGLNLFLVAELWGGYFYYMLLIASFAFIMLFINKDFGRNVKSFVPTILVAFILEQFMPANRFSFMSYSFIIAVVMLAFFAIRYAAARYNLVKKEQLKWVAPGMTALLIIGVLVGAMFSDQIYGMLDSALVTIGIVPSVVLSTVAESQPGSWDAIGAMTSAHYDPTIIPFLSPLIPYLSIWIYAAFGAIIIIYTLYKKHDTLLILLLIWLASSVAGTLGYIRLAFVLGAPFALVAAVFFSWLIERAGKFKVMENAKTLKQKINYITIPIAIFIAIVVLMNAASTYGYSQDLGPSNCIINPQILINGQKCLETDAQGNITKYASGQPWYEAFDFLKYNTTKNESLVTWWDFGYWYQERGNMPTVSDGGWGNRYEIAVWYTADVKNWSDLEPWLKGKHKVGYILQEYTLPGKYGAISKIASNGQSVVGIQQFAQSAVYPQGNKTIYEFKAGPYAVWIPISNGTAAGTPMFLISQGDQYASKSYINDLCTPNGIMHLGNETPSIGGCLAITDLGVYYIPDEAKNTIFTALQFMEGYGLPVEKIFDNKLIKIYKITDTYGG